MAAALGLDPDDVLDLSASLNPFAPDVAALARATWASPALPRRRGGRGDAGRGAGRGPQAAGAHGRGRRRPSPWWPSTPGAGWVDEPDFGLYRRHLPALDPAAPPLAVRPPQPSGRLAGPGEEAGVWDEAFLPLAAGTWTRGRPGWALGSLTKAFACPGLRLGYAIAPDGARRRRRARGPAPRVGGGRPRLRPCSSTCWPGRPGGWTAALAAARADLAATLVERGWSPLPSDAPWVLVPAPPGLREALARGGVVVRDCSSFGLVDHVRIAVPARPAWSASTAPCATWRGEDGAAAAARPGGGWAMMGGP